MILMRMRRKYGNITFFFVFIVFICLFLLKDQIKMAKRRFIQPVCNIMNYNSVQSRVRENEQIKCKYADWLIMKDGKAYAAKKILYHHIKFDCSFNHINKEGLNKVNNNDKDEEVKVNYNEEDIYHKFKRDIYAVKCWAEGDKYFGIYGHPVKKQKVIDNLNDRFHNLQKKFNILVLSLHSYSSVSFINNFPKSYGFFKKTLKGQLMNGYSIADGTLLSALLSITANKYVMDIPKNSNFSGEFIWKSIKNAGYVTVYGKHSTIELDSILKNSNFANDADHIFELKEENPIENIKLCDEYLVNENIRLYQIMTDVYDIYDDHPTFSFFHVNTLAKDNKKQYPNSDNDLYNALKKLKKKALKNTIVFLMSDVGDSSVKTPLQNVQKHYDEIQPFLGVFLPKKFKRDYPKFAENLNINEQYLTTGFDLYETFREISQLDDIEIKKLKSPTTGTSLFSAIPADRNCKNIGINTDWCPCIYNK